MTATEKVGPKLKPPTCCGAMPSQIAAYSSDIKREASLNPQFHQPFVIGAVSAGNGLVPGVSTQLTSEDRWGTFKVRCRIGRMNYKVEPGLYAVGEPGSDSPVLVTANYKMSFDFVRRELSGRNVWLLVLDTGGINVWCAAGKGSFGTRSLVTLVEATRLAEVVAHRTLILPQLAGPGVAAHKVKDLTGFRVVYGPVKAEDVPAFLDNGMRATDQMREKTFDTRERTILIPVELAEALKAAAIIVPVALIIGGLLSKGSFSSGAIRHGGLAASCVLVSIFAGAVATPVLLPWLPWRAFSAKGVIPGLIAAPAVVVVWPLVSGAPASGVEALACFLIVLSLTCYLAMNFTGASTYTSLSGVKKEMRWAVPLEIAAGVTGLGFWLGSIVVPHLGG